MTNDKMQKNKAARKAVLKQEGQARVKYNNAKALFDYISESYNILKKMPVKRLATSMNEYFFLLVYMPYLSLIMEHSQSLIFGSRNVVALEQKIRKTMSFINETFFNEKGVSIFDAKQKPDFTVNITNLANLYLLIKKQLPLKSIFDMNLVLLSKKLVDDLTIVIRQEDTSVKDTSETLLNTLTPKLGELKKSADDEGVTIDVGFEAFKTKFEKLSIANESKGHGASSSKNLTDKIYKTKKRLTPSLFGKTENGKNMLRIQKEVNLEKAQGRRKKFNARFGKRKKPLIVSSSAPTPVTKCKAVPLTPRSASAVRPTFFTENDGGSSSSSTQGDNSQNRNNQ